MEEKKITKAKEFCQKVKELAKEYDLSFFLVTEGASAVSNKGCEAIKMLGTIILNGNLSIILIPMRIGVKILSPMIIKNNN